jgi:hypothetical protein
MIDLSKLTPAPWSLREEGDGEVSVRERLANRLQSRPR